MKKERKDRLILSSILICLTFTNIFTLIYAMQMNEKWASKSYKLIKLIDDCAIWKEDFSDFSKNMNKPEVQEALWNNGSGVELWSQENDTSNNSFCHFHGVVYNKPFSVLKEVVRDTCSIRMGEIYVENIEPSAFDVIEVNIVNFNTISPLTIPEGLHKTENPKIWIDDKGYLYANIDDFMNFTEEDYSFGNR